MKPLIRRNHAINGVALRLDGVAKLLVELHPPITGNEAANRVVRQLVESGFLVDFDKSRLNQVYLTRQGG